MREREKQYSNIIIIARKCGAFIFYWQFANTNKNYEDNMEEKIRNNLVQVKMATLIFVKR